jgi:hypothetical protein
MTGDKLIIERSDNQWTARIYVLLEASIPSQAGKVVTVAGHPGMVPATPICEI